MNVLWFLQEFFLKGKLQIYCIASDIFERGCFIRSKSLQGIVLALYSVKRFHYFIMTMFYCSSKANEMRGIAKAWSSALALWPIVIPI